MNTEVETRNVDNRRLIDGLKHALDGSYAQLVKIARREWERNFTGKDPSDACVSVRITSGDSRRSLLPCAGILRKPGRSLLNGNGRPSLA
jgi:hypothetical protein